MRLALFLSIIGVSVLISLLRPFWGFLVFSWLAYMRPQNLAWAEEGWRFSYYVAIALLIGCLLNAHKEKFFVKARENYLLIALWIVLGFSTFFSIWPGQSFPKFIEISKIFLIAILTASLVNSKERFKYLCLVIALSLSFWGVKGAIWGILRGWHLQGPAGSMIADNNDFALALNMTLPFLLYLGMNEKTRIKRWFFFAQFPLVIIAIIYTFSRGGFIGLCAVVLILFLKSRRKVLGFLALVLGAILFLNFAPQGYKERIETIKTYEQDESAVGRVYAWQAAWGMAKNRPLTGVGLRNFMLAFPNYHWFGPRVAHNSYFQLLAECGFIALALFLLLLFFSIKKLRSLRRKIPFNNNTAWVHNYSHMLEVGFIGYMVSGMFLSRADFDLMYQFIGMSIALDQITHKEIEFKE